MWEVVVGRWWIQGLPGLYSETLPQKINNSNICLPIFIHIKLENRTWALPCKIENVIISHLSICSGMCLPLFLKAFSHPQITCSFRVMSPEPRAFQGRGGPIRTGPTLLSPSTHPPQSFCFSKSSWQPGRLQIPVYRRKIFTVPGKGGGSSGFRSCPWAVNSQGPSYKSPENTRSTLEGFT